MARYIKVDGIVLNPNAGFNISIEDISSSDSGRSLDATMQKTIVATKTTITLNFSNLSDSNISRVLKAAKTNTYVQLTYPSPYEGKDIEAEFYSGSPEITHKVTVNDIHFWDLKLTFIQR